MLAQLGTFATRQLERIRKEVTPDTTVYEGKFAFMVYRDGTQRVHAIADLEVPGAYADIARRAFADGINCPPDPSLTKAKLATR
jgi:hypothetical protein